MINLHLYRSTFKNQSRVKRETETIEQLDIFEEIHLVGINQDNEFDKEERVSKSIKIFRFLSRNYGENKIIIGGKIFIWYLIVLKKYWNKNLKCINCHSVNVLPISILLKLLTGSKLIYDAHELETETTSLSGFIKIIAKLAENLFIRLSDYSIFVSKSIEDWYIKEYSLSNTIKIYNCPYYKEKITSDYLHKKFNINKNKKIYLYQGLFSEHRGLEQLLNIFSSTEIDCPLVFLGFGKLESLIKDYADKNTNIHFHSRVPYDEMHLISSSAQIGIALVDGKYLNHQYCLPNKVFEYIMADLPLLVSNTFELRRFVRSNNVGISCDFSEADILKSIKKINLKYDFYKNNLGILRKEYNFNNQKKKLINLYKNLDLK